MNQRQKKSLSARWTERIQWDVDMAPYCTLRAGGRAAGLLAVQSQKELAELLQQLNDLQLDYLLLGGGSNVLVRPEGFAGLVIRLQGDFITIALMPPEDDAVKKMVYVGAGCSLAALLAWCSREGVSGLEFLTGIPGSVGGAVHMNAGAWEHEIGECIQGIELIDCCGKVHVVGKEELVFSYRRTTVNKRFSGRCSFVATTLLLRSGRVNDIKKRCRDYNQRRKKNQPQGVASAGSFFKNPDNDYAGRLIEAAGLKGKQYGKAMVSPVHANFIVNCGGATAEDILGLMDVVQESVMQQFGIRLEPEVQII